MRENSWQKKLERSRYIEREILKWYQKHIDKDAHLPATHQEEYDILSKKVGNVEVKEDRVAHQTDYYALEFENYKGEPSGLNKTTAKEFVLVDAGFVIFIATESLRYLIEQSKDKRVVFMGYTTENGRRARGWLIPRKDILYSTYAKTLKRWFK